MIPEDLDDDFWTTGAMVRIENTGVALWLPKATQDELGELCPADGSTITEDELHKLLVALDDAAEAGLGEWERDIL